MNKEMEKLEGQVCACPEKTRKKSGDPGIKKCPRFICFFPGWHHILSTGKQSQIMTTTRMEMIRPQGCPPLQLLRKTSHPAFHFHVQNHQVVRHLLCPPPKDGTEEEERT